MKLPAAKIADCWLVHDIIAFPYSAPDKRLCTVSGNVLRKLEL